VVTLAILLSLMLIPWVIVRRRRRRLLLEARWLAESELEELS